MNALTAPTLIDIDCPMVTCRYEHVKAKKVLIKGIETLRIL
jgi:hypothetical protein